MNCASSGWKGTEVKRSEKLFWGVVIAAAVALLLACASGCSTLDRAYKQEVVWTNAPVVHVFTNTVVVTNTVPVVTERTNVVYVTNDVDMAEEVSRGKNPSAPNFSLK